MRLPKQFETITADTFFSRLVMIIAVGCILWVLGALCYALALGIYWYPRIVGLIVGAIVLLFLITLGTFLIFGGDDI